MKNIPLLKHVDFVIGMVLATIGLGFVLIDLLAIGGILMIIGGLIIGTGIKL